MKIAFESRADANAYALGKGFIGCEKPSDKRQLRPYQCYYCSKWHLTSQSKKQTKSAERKRKARKNAKSSA